MVLGLALSSLAVGLAAASSDASGLEAELAESQFNCPPWQEMREAVKWIPLEGTGAFIPFYGSEPSFPEQGGPKIAMIQLHQKLRDAEPTFNIMKNAAFRYSNDSTIVVSPVFPDRECTASMWLGDEALEGVAPIWKRTGDWVNGAVSQEVGDWEGISSFQVVDTIIEWLHNTHGETLEKIYFTGYSAGGQMCVRWAVMSPYGQNGKAPNGKATFTIICGAPSSVVWINDKRPATSCSENKKTGLDHRCTDFKVPADADSCEGKYDEYPWGMSSFGDTGLDSYINQKSENSLSLPDQFRTKDFWLLVGAYDTKLCDGGGCAADCASQLQGKNRLQRGQNFISHLADAFPETDPWAKWGNFPGGHSADHFYNCDEFIMAFHGEALPEFVPSGGYRNLILGAVAAAVVVVLAGLGFIVLVRRRKSRGPGLQAPLREEVLEEGREEPGAARSAAQEEASGEARPTAEPDPLVAALDARWADAEARAAEAEPRSGGQRPASRFGADATPSEQSGD